MKRPLALLSLAALALTACQPAGGSTIKIGFLGPLTGDIAALGKDMLNGITMAIDDVNAKGGVSGKKIELVTEDAKCTGAEAANGAQKLVNVDKVIAIIGGFCSGETLAAAPITEAGKVLLFSPGSSSPDVTKAGSFVFRNFPSDALKTIAMAKYFNESGYKTMAIITENTDYATAQRDALLKNFGADKTVFNEAVEPGTKDYRSLITRLKSMDFDVFVPNGQSDSTNAAMIQQFREAGLTQPIVGTDTTDSQVVIDIAKDAAEGVHMVNVPTSGEGKTFETDFTAKYGKPLSSIAWAAHSYDAAGVLIEALKSGAVDGEALRQYFDAMKEYTGVIGTFHFDENGDVVGIPFVLKTISGGKISTVKPIPID